MFIQIGTQQLLKIYGKYFASLLNHLIESEYIANQSVTSETAAPSLLEIGHI